MTKEDAIKEVMAVFDTWEWEFGAGIDLSKEHEARDMAIKALEQEPILDKVRSEIEELPNMNEVGVFSSIRMKRMILEIIDKHKGK